MLGQPPTSGWFPNFSSHRESPPLRSDRVVCMSSPTTETTLSGHDFLKSWCDGLFWMVKKGFEEGFLFEECVF